MSAIEPETVYFTEKGVDLLKIFPEVAELQLAMAAGWCWSDVEQYHPAQFAVPRKPIRVLYTTEAEKNRLLGTQSTIEEAQVTQEVKKAQVQAQAQEVQEVHKAQEEATLPDPNIQTCVANILADLQNQQKQSQENLSLEYVTDYIASAIYKIKPENLHAAILDGVAQDAATLIQEPQENLVQDKVEELEESGYFKSLYNRAYNYLASWIY